MKIRSIKFAPIIGFGYWKDIYKSSTGFIGEAHNIVIPFVRMQFGYLVKIDVPFLQEHWIKM